ncbi:inositol monophosphatase family protein [Halanaerobium sp. ST460_2HS_T2]|uniref:inositol monophosphatase family protein n=1 Tax=Halanaerobium sp. ST460_2HS_T2 TaxID=2183914 RepID=UPI000DF4101B|nr:inositol monophosphatase family protein [Halanaerobium sp. ST460_2HS_T2]RCW49818.1 myo-inositol-1(or 4)-monophosphatase [Halanaerobium sp. ST460_2HS_T2]
MVNLVDAQSLAKEWALEVGKLQREKLKKKNLEINTKSTLTDLVTEIDILSENMIKEKIEKSYPGHNILGEESNYTDKKSKYTWVIDPLDGTNNYASSYPIYCVSIALKYNNKIVLGVVYIPELDEIYSAIKDKGAYKSGQAIEISQKSSLSNSLVATGFPYDKKESTIDNLEPLNKILKNIRGLRRSGSAAFDLVSVASGRIDAYWEFKLKEWDFAAGELLVKEAGGEVFKTEIEGEPLFIAGSKELVNELRMIIEAIYKK